jgi:hypothetical protein
MIDPLFFVFAVPMWAYVLIVMVLPPVDEPDLG